MDIQEVRNMLENNDLTQVYDCSPFTKCAGFTYLHKLVLLANKYPQLNDMIRNIDPKEINKVNEKGWSALHLAARNSNLETTKLLIELGADVNLQANDGCTALMLAAEYSCKEIIKILLKLDAGMIHNIDPKKIDMVDEDGWSTLHYAVRGSNVETTKLLIELGADVKLQANNGCTVLMLAAEYSCKEIIKILFKLDTDMILNIDPEEIDRVDEDGWSALHYAVNNSNIETTKLLIELGADVNLQEKDGGTALMLAAVDSSKEIIKILLKLDTDMICNIDPKEIDRVDEDGWSALHFAVYNSNIEATKLLIELGADVNLQEKYGGTALMLAAIDSSKEIVKLLLKSGADVNAHNDTGFTALTLSVMYKNETSNIGNIKLLLKSGANVDKANNTGYTALMIAALYSNKCSNIQTVKLLLKYGSDINKVCNNGLTALMVASKYSNTTSNIQTVKLLLKYGADIDKSNNTGYTALMIASEHSNTTSNIQTVKLLIKYGADVNKVNDEGESALTYALKCNNMDTIKLLLKNCANISVSLIKGYSRKVQKILLKYMALKVEDIVIESGKVPTCVICLSNVAQILVAPCNHLIFCGQCCAKKILGVCPMCKSRIKTYDRVYF